MIVIYDIRFQGINSVQFLVERDIFMSKLQNFPTQKKEGIRWSMFCFRTGTFGKAKRNYSPASKVTVVMSK